MSPNYPRTRPPFDVDRIEETEYELGYVESLRPSTLHAILAGKRYANEHV